MKSLKDQRHHKRYELEAYVDYTGKEFLLNHKITDLSLGGMKLQTKEVDKVGQEVDIILTLPDLEAVIEIKAEVVWSNPEEHIMGLKFKRLGIKEHKLLQEYLNKTATN